MHTEKRIPAALLSLVVAVAALTAGCAEERPAIDRVQPNGLSKQFFNDEWYYQRTVVDMPGGNGFTVVGMSDFMGLTKMSWDIEEGYLYARRATELIINGDRKAEEGEGYQGEIVAAFSISSHFDIANAYNPTTGEKLNVIEENTSDRPWYEREYIRVDWSENLVHNPGLDFEAHSVESVPYYVQEFDDATGERNRDAPHFDTSGRYFDITNKLIATADTMEYPGYGTIPLCWLWGEEFTECGASEYSIRHSFLKIDPDRQYEPQPYKGPTTDLFGFFTSDRMTYDRDRGIRQQDKARYLTRHNIWQKWRNGSGELIPAADRALRPVVYYVNPDMPDTLRPILDKVADQWNEIFLDVARAAGNDPGDQRAFVLCRNNPLEKDDPAECFNRDGADTYRPVLEPGDSPRLGDLRFSFMAFVPKYMKYGLLGFGPSNNDPETGEIISGQAYVYHHNDNAVFRTLEMIELLNGNRDPTAYIDGVDLNEWVDQTNANQSHPDRTFGLEDADVMTDRIANGWASKYWSTLRQPPTEADREFQHKHGFRNWAAPHLHDMYQRGLLNGERHAPDAKLANLKDTYIEDLLLDEEVLMMAGHEPGMPVTEWQKKRASVARGGFGQFMRDRGRLMRRFAEERNMYLPEMADDAMMGLARQLKDESSEKAQKIIHDAIYTAVMTHEVGHTLGLMHNFGGSDDAINYDDEYWKIRDDGEVGPRVVDPITDDEINAHLYNYAYSSIMDYAGRYTVDAAGVGKYDRAAMLFGYANKVEVFRDSVGVSTEDFRNWYDSDGDVLYFNPEGPSHLHYTTFYNTMGTKLYEADNRRLVDVSDLNEDLSTAKVGDTVYARVPYIYCSHNRSNLGDNCLTRDAGADSMERMKNMLDDLNTWYISRNFPRGQIGVDMFGYVSRWYPRVYDRLKNWNDLYALYNELMGRFFTPEQHRAFLNDPVNGWGAKTWAVQNAFNYLVQTIMMPDIGLYGGPLMQPDLTQLMVRVGDKEAVERMGMQTADLGVDQARYYSTSWHDGERNCGYMWSECLHHIGTYLDKIMAIEALTDSQTNFVARTSPEDIRQWEVSYYTTYPQVISELNHAMLRRNFAKIGPYIDNGKLKFPNFTSDMSFIHTAPIDPFATFTIQLYWQVLGQARFKNNYDYSFNDESRVFVLGTGRAPDLPPQDIIEFHDPISGLRYGALKVSRQRAGGTELPGGAEGLLMRALTMQGLSSFCDSNRKTALVEDDCKPVDPASQAYVTAELLDHIELIKVMSDVSSVMDLGDPYNP